MPVQIDPFTMTDYDDVVAFWNAQEGIGLSEADERDGMALYLARNPGMSLVVRQGARLSQPCCAGTTAGGATCIIWRSPRHIAIGELEKPLCNPVCNGSAGRAFKSATCSFSARMLKVGVLAGDGICKSP
jgi:hypothetical protein